MSEENSGWFDVRGMRPELNLEGGDNSKFAEFYMLEPDELEAYVTHHAAYKEYMELRALFKKAALTEEQDTRFRYLHALVNSSFGGNRARNPLYRAQDKVSMKIAANERAAQAFDKNYPSRKPTDIRSNPMSDSTLPTEQLVASANLDEEETREFARMTDEMEEYLALRKRREEDPNSLSYAEGQRLHLLWVNINGSVGRPDNLRNRVRSKLIEALLTKAEPKT